MISESERYQGNALRQIIVSAKRPVSIGAAEVSERINSVQHRTDRLPNQILDQTPVALEF